MHLLTLVIVVYFFMWFGFFKLWIYVQRDNFSFPRVCFHLLLSVFQWFQWPGGRGRWCLLLALGIPNLVSSINLDPTETVAQACHYSFSQGLPVSTQIPRARGFSLLPCPYRQSFCFSFVFISPFLGLSMGRPLRSLPLSRVLAHCLKPGQGHISLFPKVGIEPRALIV